MKSVVICGSRRFKAEMRELAQVLKEAGIIVFEPFLRSGREGDWDKLSAEDKRYVALGLTFGHFRKIDLADVVFIYNKDGYSGVSTTLELAYAVARNKVIYAFETDPESCRLVLFHEIVSTLEALIERLR